MPPSRSSTSPRANELVDLLAGWSGRADLAERLGVGCGRCERVLELLPTNLLANAQALAEALEVTPSVFVQACCGHPDLLYQSPDATRARVVALAGILDVSPQRLFAIVRSRGDLLMFSPETVRAKLAETARRLGISETAFAACLRKAPALWGLRPERIEGNARHLAARLGLGLEGVVRIAVRQPSILLRSEDGVERFMRDGSAAFGVPPEEVARMVCRCPSLLSQKITTLDGNATRLAMLLGVERAAVMDAARRNPSFLRCNPDHSAAALIAVSTKLGLSMAHMSAIVLRMPSLVGRTPSGIVKRTRLAARISAALGRPLSLIEIMERMPAVPTYSVDRLLVRLLVAHLGLWTWDASSLIAKSDRHIRSLLEGYAAKLPVGSLAVTRLRTIIDTRMPKAL